MSTAESRGSLDPEPDPGPAVPAGMVATHGRQEEADKVMANIEEAVRRSGQELAPIDESKAIEIVPLTSVGGQAVPAASAAPTAA